jgi:hypothetical protein
MEKSKKEKSHGKLNSVHSFVLRIQRPANNQATNFTSSSSNFGQFGIPQVAASGVVVDVPVPT